MNQSTAHPTVIDVVTPIGKEELVRFKKCSNAKHLADSIFSIWGERISDKRVLDVYLKEKKFQIASHNGSFDEAYYRLNYPDIAKSIMKGDVIRGFCHFVSPGFQEDRFPSRAIELGIKDEKNQAAELSD